MPSTLCPPGQQVEVGLGVKLVRIYHRGRLVKVHPDQPRGGRSTDTADYPAELSAYTLRAPDGIKRSAAEQGAAVAEFAERLLGGPLPWSKSGRATSSSGWGNATLPSAWTPPAARPWTWTSLTCVALSAS